MEEDEDRVLLSRLGVASADVDDVEHDVLRKVENDAICIGEDLENKNEHSADATSAKRAKLVSKLQAVNFEIGAVAASIDHVKNAKGDEECSPDGVDLEKGHAKDANAPDHRHTTPDRLDIQHALATERLWSLKQTKVDIQNEIAKFDESTPSTSIGRSNLLSKLVEEEPKHKRKFIENQHSLKNSKKKVIAYDEDVEFDAMLDAASSGFVETEKDALVRKGIMTPFHKLKGFERCVQQPGPSSSPGLPEEATEDFASTSIARVTQSMLQIAESRSATKLVDAKSLPKLEGPTHTFQRLKARDRCPASPTSASVQKRQKMKKSKRPLPGKNWRKRVEDEDLQNGLEEGEEKDSVVLDHESEESGEVEDRDDGGSSCVALEGGLRIPDFIFTRLFDYQKVGVQWLWELHCQRAGGIIGDEMGLGKTVQVLSFLGSLHFSRMYKPSIVICPVTLLRQWQREAKKWYPKFHVEILHDSAHGSIAPAQSIDDDSNCESDGGSAESRKERPRSLKPSKRWDNLINGVLKSESSLLITTYEQLRILGEKLLDIEWGYAILDEGHRIRNPNAEVTLICKQLQTVHRIIMTGAPIQNKLAELWSLFDFIFPGKLGVLPVFEMEFAVPISVGGYANATPLQVSTAYRCAVVLRDLIMPYLLRRMKADVNACLPKKTEHVLFCSLTSEQRSLYCAFLASSEVEQIFDGSRNSLFGIDVMRKICNHPDLLEREHASQHPDYGNTERSGKMKVVSQLLELWKGQGHRVLAFTQTQQMLDILENFLIVSGYIYRRMDGSTPVKQRMALIDEFNNSTEVFVFILTTRVGGLGTNLTGADRVIIYDPDWNPSTDVQARERAWRIGQTRDVTVYRLITRGTIEEKVYHRQIYKQFLTNKVLKNPKQKRFFKARDMRDLFTLQDEESDRSTETSNIFSQLNGDVNIEIHEEGKVAPISSDDVQGGKTMDLGTDTSRVKGKKKVNDSGSEMDEETNVLKSLFDANGIHSAVNHDVIMNANDVDRVKMEEQASLIAQKAADALRQSRMLRSQDRFSVPTWTGKSGAAGAPSSVRRKFGSTVNTSLLGSSKVSPETSSSKSSGFQVGVSSGRVLSSAELLARMQGTQEKAVFDGLEHQLGSSPSISRTTPAASRSKPSNNNTIVQPEVLIRQMCTFMQQRGGSAGSGCIVEHFKDMIPTKDLPLFRNLLKQIAVLEKDASGHGSQWVLKPEYLD